MIRVGEPLEFKLVRGSIQVRVNFREGRCTRTGDGERGEPARQRARSPFFRVCRPSTPLSLSVMSARQLSVKFISMLGLFRKDIAAALGSLTIRSRISMLGAREVARQENEEVQCKRRELESLLCTIYISR